jgi:hypothetical protein
MPDWRRILVEWPAKAVDAWFVGYRVLLTALTIVTVSAVVLMLVLAAFGIRWAW